MKCLRAAALFLNVTWWCSTTICLFGDNPIIYTHNIYTYIFIGTFLIPCVPVSNKWAIEFTKQIKQEHNRANRAEMLSTCTSIQVITRDEL